MHLMNSQRQPDRDMDSQRHAAGPEQIAPKHGNATPPKFDPMFACVCDARVNVRLRVCAFLRLCVFTRVRVLLFMCPSICFSMCVRS